MNKLGGKLSTGDSGRGQVSKGVEEADSSKVSRIKVQQINIP